MPSRTEFAAAAEQEIVDLHVVLQAWFNAEGEADLPALLAHFDPGFIMVTPGGAVLDYAVVSANFANLRGTRPGLVMEIENPVTRYAGADAALVTYREIQHQDGRTTQRLSTALLLRSPRGGEPVWRHLQETWIA